MRVSSPEVLSDHICFLKVHLVIISSLKVLHIKKLIVHLEKGLFELARDSSKYLAITWSASYYCFISLEFA